MAAQITTPAYILLGLLERHGEATPYDLKRLLAEQIAFIWTIPHSHVYVQTKRLAEAGLISEREDATGKRKRLVYSITDTGREALQRWLGEPAGGNREFRDEALVKIFFDADAQELAAQQTRLHREQLKLFKSLRAGYPEEGAEGPRYIFDLGIAVHGALARFWAQRSGD